MSRADAVAEARRQLQGQHPLHGPDQRAGGNPEQITGMGDGGVNSSIGSQWRNNADDLQAAMDDALVDADIDPAVWGDIRMNVRSAWSTRCRYRDGREHRERGSERQVRPQRRPRLRLHQRADGGRPRLAAGGCRFEDARAPLGHPGSRRCPVAGPPTRCCGQGGPRRVRRARAVALRLLPPAGPRRAQGRHLGGVEGGRSLRPSRC
ncbi:hypothetical protein GC089_18095 [Cellulomonas sp. JZ18]|nr:hypothetical protein GC089_18095 [Cellulomonas sp. JZ18]